MVCEIDALRLEYHLRCIARGTPDAAYATGFPSDGRVCTAFDVPATRALQSSDTVRFLECRARDPVVSVTERRDAARLLSQYVYPDAANAGVLGRGESLLMPSRRDVTCSDWVGEGLVRSRVGESCSALQCGECGECECLADPEVLRERGEAVCLRCGAAQEQPEYPV